jgi:hypothetical protein
MSRRVPSSGHHPEWPGEPERGQEYGDEYGARHDGYGYDGDPGGGYDQGQYGQYAGPNGHQGYASQYGPGQYGAAQYGPGQYGAAQYGQAAGNGQQQPQGGQDWGYDGQPTQALGYQGNDAGYQGNGYQASSYPGHAYPEHNGFENVRSSGNMRRYENPQGYSDTQRLDDPQRFGDTQRLDDAQRFDDPRRLSGMQRTDNAQRFDDRGGYQGQGQGQYGGPGRPGRPPSGRPARDLPPGRKVRFRRTRRLFRRTSVRVISAVVALFLLLAMFSAGQAAFKNNGQGMAANLAEWARDHYLGPVVTFGEWLSYNPPPKGGKPSFSLAVPSGQAVTSGKPQKGGKHKGKTFVPDIPATLKSLAPSPIAGEGQWRLAEKVKGYPAILTTFLRSATYTSQVNGVASIDQRLVKFSLRPGTEDPGSSPWGYSDTYIPQGKRTGLLATFNGGFKLDSAGGGFYLNGSYHGTLVTGAASVVYYKNGTMKIGEWGRDFTMNSKIAGVRQNLKLIIDHGKISPNLNQDIMTKFGATLGGGYYVWRSGLGITKDGRIVYVYGPALNVQDLAELLHRAGAVEGMQMDINPAWMKFDYYQAKGSSANPTPVTLLPTQQPSAYSYYSASTRDFTAVFAR